MAGKCIIGLCYSHSFSLTMIKEVKSNCDGSSVVGESQRAYVMKPRSSVSDALVLLRTDGRML